MERGEHKKILCRVLLCFVQALCYKKDVAINLHVYTGGVGIEKTSVYIICQAGCDYQLLARMQ